MKAWLIDKMGGIGGLRLSEAPDPAPKQGEALIRVRMAGLNPADRYLAEGQYPAKPKFPHVLGRECVGQVLELGESTSGLSPGERVVLLHGEVGASCWGTFAELVVAPADRLAPVPDGWTDPEAAGATLASLTAMQALTQFGTLPTSTILITGASGGVGSAAVQLASAMGHRVIALTRSDAKLAQLLELGAEYAINCTEAIWTRRLRQSLGETRVDLAIDNIGGELLPQVIDMMGMDGKISIVGRLAGPVPMFNTSTLLFRRLHMRGVALSTWETEQLHAAWQVVVGLFAKTNRRPVVDRIFPMEDLPAAFARLAEGPLGKVILQVH